MKLTEQEMTVFNFISLIGETLKDNKFLRIKNQHNIILFTSNKYNIHSIPKKILNSSVYRYDIEYDFFTLRVFK